MARDGEGKSFRLCKLVLCLMSAFRLCCFIHVLASLYSLEKNLVQQSVASHHHPDRKKPATYVEVAACPCIKADLSMQDATVLCFFPVGAMYNTDQGMTV